MRIFLPTINGQIEPKGYTSLKGACKLLEVDYNQAVRGKRVWDDKVILEIEIIKQVRNGSKRTM